MPASAQPNLQSQLAFQTELNRINHQIHGAGDISKILSTMSEPIGKLLGAERITIYAVDTKNNRLFSIKFGTQPPQIIRVNRDENSLAGFCALSKRTLNIRDVYDEAELRQIHAKLRFDRRWDKAMGFRTRQVLAIPLVFEKYLLGVLQLINRKDGKPFSDGDTKAAEEIGRTLAIAFYNQNRCQRAGTGKRRLYGDLVDRGLLSEKELEEDVTHARVNCLCLGSYLMTKHQVPKAEIGKALADFYSCDFFFFDGSQTIPEDLKTRVRYDFWKKNKCAPVKREGVAVKVAVVDPFDLNRIDLIKSVGLAPRIEAVAGLEPDILAYLNHSFGVAEEEAEVVEPPQEGDFAEILTELEAGEVGEVIDQGDEDDESEEVQGVVVRLANKIISDAFRDGVSDIHIEPCGKTDPCVIRFRRDGRCYKYQEIPASHRSALASRLKIMSQLDISERRKPQDGKIRFRMSDGQVIELRVACIPTSGVGNEDIVMRILAASKPIPLDKLGMHPEYYDKFQQVVREPYGLVLVVGPTGSGKTTTLHSALGFINREDIKIWTAEDPVEITQKGLRQVQVKPKIGFDFAAAMRAFLRADPDVIMIGEMRDQETAATGIEASLTGHLVFSTLHTNSAPETVTRLLDMGLDPFNFADALLAVLAQRLVRTLCKKCKEPYAASQEEFDELRKNYGPAEFDRRIGIKYGPDFQLYRGPGCPACADSGYRGRMGIHELLMGSDGLKRIILANKTVDDIRKVAIEEGMMTLLQDGIWKVTDGHTDLSQVRAVCMK
ncbi:GspE/PulE family protein [Sulfidibacter corallicola]|uniref:GspE/PulE family protein n=1 Tax=Sulfidibacter corallicola TaxID=2818388 RepID=A0A8A4TP30_SULCO|nr:GspE/PulE family protein [Sulfidibacter corallicola]QTD51187.1 GspE/PulE family protein [Sulfidibacter corallicola]